MADSTLLTFRDLIGRLLIRVNSRISYDEAKLTLDDSWREILNTWQWSFTKTGRLAITSVAQYNTGTVNVTNNSTAVVGVGTVWTSAMVGRYFIAGGQPYKISAVPSGTSLTLQNPYAGTTATGATYAIRQLEYELGEGVGLILSITGPGWYLEERSLGTINVIDKDRDVTGEPIYYSYIDRVDSGASEGRQRIELWPGPTSVMHFPYVGLKRSALTNIATIIADITPVLTQRALHDAYILCAVKADSEDRSFFVKLAKDALDLYRIVLEEYRRLDERRFGRDEGQIEDVLYRLSGRTDIDTG